jgi:hypothetical protein
MAARESQADLQALRTAAQGREWTALQDRLKRMLARLEPLVAVEIAARRLHAHLPRFEFYYPEAGWLRELLLTIVSYGSAPRDLPDHAVTQFPSPGCGNYVMAVLDLARAVQIGVSPFERYSYITNATANGVLAELMDLYFRERLEEWQHLNEQAAAINPATGLSIREELTMKFWSDPAVAARDTAIWLEIAASLEEKLSSA